MTVTCRQGMLLSALTLLIFPTVAGALTVTGSVQERDGEHVLVGNTHFLVDSKTRVRQNPGPDEPTVPYQPGLLEDVYKVRVSGTGRKADLIVILPYGYDRGGSAQ